MSGQNLSGKIKDLFGSVVSDSDRLPNERDLALKFGVSRHAVRKALERLEIEGQLWRHVGRGTFRGQRPNPATSDADVVIQHASLREIVETRKIIEPQIAALAAVRASAAQVGAIEDAGTFFAGLWEIRGAHQAARGAGNVAGVLDARR